MANSHFNSAAEGGYTVLHALSDFSIGRSTASIEKLVEKAKLYSMKDLAITDIDLSSSLAFYQRCLQNDIKPIIGQKIPYHRSYILLYCKDFEAYQILCRKSLILQNYSGSENDFPFSKDEGTHFVCITPEYDSEQLKNTFSSDLYREIKFFELTGNTYPIDNIEATASVITNEVNFINKDDIDALYAFRKIRLHKTDTLNTECYFKSEKEIQPYLAEKGLQILLHNTLKISDSISFIFPENYFDSSAVCSRITENLPKIDIPNTISDHKEYLQNLVTAGLKKRYSVITKEIQHRADLEMSSICNHDWEKLFLYYRELTQWCKTNNIYYGPGRGAAAGSIVCYALNITDVDPISEGLLYEPFAQPEKTVYPDINIECEYNAVQQVITHIKDTYGEKNTARIAVHGTIKTNEAITIAAEALGYDNSEINSLLTSIRSPDSKTIESLINDGKLTKYEKLLNLAKKLEGLKNNKTIHASGIITANKPIQEITPVYTDSETGKIICQYTPTILEAAGLYKYDIIGLIQLKKLNDIKKIVNADIDPLFDFNDISPTDESTIKIFQSAQTSDVFRFEAPFIQKHLQEVKPQKISDLEAMNALYRPNLMHLMTAFTAHKNEGKRIPLFREFETILTDTYGLPLYKEQITCLLHTISGMYSADDDQKQKTEKLYAAVETYAVHAVDKSYIAGDTKLAWQDAYLKAHFSQVHITVCKNMRKEEAFDKS